MNSVRVVQFMAAQRQKTCETIEFFEVGNPAMQGTRFSAQALRQEWGLT